MDDESSASLQLSSSSSSGMRRSRSDGPRSRTVPAHPYAVVSSNGRVHETPSSSSATDGTQGTPASVIGPQLEQNNQQLNQQQTQVNQLTATSVDNSTQQTQINQVQNNIIAQNLTEEQLTEIVNARVQQAMNAAVQENIALRSTAEAVVTRVQSDAHQHVAHVQASANLENQRTVGMAEVALLEANARKSSAEEENLRLKDELNGSQLRKSSVEEENLRLRDELRSLKEAQLVSQKLEARNASPSTPPRRSRPPRPGSSGYRSPNVESTQSFQTANDPHGEETVPAPSAPQIPASLQASSVTGANETNNTQWYGDLWRTVTEMKSMMQEMQMRNEEDDMTRHDGYSGHRGNVPTVTGPDATLSSDATATGSTATSSSAAIAPTAAALAPSTPTTAAPRGTIGNPYPVAPIVPSARTRSKSVEFRKEEKRSTSARRRHRSSSSRRSSRKGSRNSDSSDASSSKSTDSSDSSSSRSPRSSSTSTGKRSGADDDDDYDEDEIAKWLHRKIVDKKGHWFFPGDRSDTASWLLKGEKEKDVYSAKSLSSFSLSSLPKTAGQFHLWVPAICSAIAKADSTERDVLSKAISFAAEGGHGPKFTAALQQVPSGLTMFQKHIAAEILRPEVMQTASEEAAVKITAFVKVERKAGRTPKGLALISIISEDFRIDEELDSGVNQVHLLNLALEGNGLAALKSFQAKMNGILNELSQDDMPSKKTMFRWLFHNLRGVPMLQKDVGKIEEAGTKSSKRSFAWLSRALQKVITKKKYATNQESIAKLVAQEPPRQLHAVPAQLHAAPAQHCPGHNAPTAMAANTSLPYPPPPGPPAMAAGETPKGKGRGKQKGKKGAAIDGQTQAPGGQPRSPGGKGRKRLSEMSATEKKQIRCVFHRRGSCTAGNECEFSHECEQDLLGPRAAPAAPKAAPAAPTGGNQGGTPASGQHTGNLNGAAATIAAAAAAAELLGGAGATKIAASEVQQVAHSFLPTIRCLIPLILTMFSSLEARCATMIESDTVPGLPSQILNRVEGARSLAVELLGDTGAGETIGSMNALKEQGIPIELIESLCESLRQPLKFSTGGGIQEAKKRLSLWNQTLGNVGMYLLDSSPLALALGKEVEDKKRTLIWQHGNLPYLALDSNKCRVWCPLSNRWTATRVHHHVPIFTAHLKTCGNALSPEEMVPSTAAAAENVSPGEASEAAPCAQPAADRAIVQDKSSTGLQCAPSFAQQDNSSTGLQTALSFSQQSTPCSAPLDSSSHNIATTSIQSLNPQTGEGIAQPDSKPSESQKLAHSLKRKQLKSVRFQDSLNDFETESTRTPNDDLEEMIADLDESGDYEEYALEKVDDCLDPKFGCSAVDKIYQDAMEFCARLENESSGQKSEFYDALKQNIDIHRGPATSLIANASDSPSTRRDPAFRRGLSCIEFCTSEDSNLGKVAESYGIELLRLTEQNGNVLDDLLIEQLEHHVRMEPGIDLWASVPCSPWSTWQAMCVHLYGESYREKLRKMRLQSRHIIRNFIKLAETVMESGGRIAYEWPRGASGWALPEITQFIKKWGLFVVDFDGCAFGATDPSGNPILKRWRVMTSCPRLANTFVHQRCQHEKGFKHTVIQGGLTAKTASYPPAMCEAIISSWYPNYTHAHVPAMSVVGTMTCSPCADQGDNIPGCPCEIHRVKEFQRFDFADIPYFSPAALEFQNDSGELMSFAMPGGEDGFEPEGEAAPAPIAPLPKSERLRAEAKSLDHMVLHDCKNGDCEACLRGRMLSKYTHSVRPDDDDEDPVYTKPTKYGLLLSADNIIASAENAGAGNERTALHIRDHYSGVTITYPQADRTEDSNYKSMKHFAGVNLTGSSETIIKTDNSSELTNPARWLAWNSDPSRANSWPHNSSCERDIRSLKEMSRPSHLQAGFWRKLWPLSLDYTSKARSFFSDAPIYDYEKGTEVEEAKKNKSRFEVASGSPFHGVKYPLGALVYYRAAGDGLAEATTKPGLFAGWKLESGLRYRDTVLILDYEAIRLRQHKHWEPRTIHQKEVFFPPVEHMEFPLANAARRAISEMTDAASEARKVEYERSLTRGVLPYEVAIDTIPEHTVSAKTRHEYITFEHKCEFGPTLGCGGCENGHSRHNASCRERFDKLIKEKKSNAAKSSAASPAPEPTSSSGSTDHTVPGGIHAPLRFIEEMTEHMQSRIGLVHAAVTRLLDRTETLNNPKALEAIRKEADGLLRKGTWDLQSVREKSDLIRESLNSGEKVHIGNLMTICSEKFAEMEEAMRVLKGRVVYRGDVAKDESGAAAIYQNLTASPTSITAANANIAYGKIPGHRTSSADAVKAYVQSLLKSEHPTWVQIPKELWPESWGRKYHRPVCKLVKSLYGHPESGAHWEQHLTDILLKLPGKFRNCIAIPEHPSSFYFPECGLLLTVYVDDLLLSGPSEIHDEFWKLLCKEVELEDIAGLGRFLGRYHDEINVDGSEGIVFNMKEYVKSACDLYESLPGSRQLKSAPTPFLPEGSLVPEDDNVRGELAPNACKVLMKALWAGRLARPDIVKAITALATKVQKWTRNHDRMLYRLMCYMHTTCDHMLIGYVGDKLEDLWLELFVDADFCGDREDAYSTSGGWLVLVGSRTWFPLCWASKKQTAVSRSTTESEVVALAYSLFKDAMPMCSLWDLLANRPMKLKIREDNQACILICEAGFSTKLRHITRTHKVNISSIKDELRKDYTEISYTESSDQCADIFTKAVEPQKWGNAVSLIKVLPDAHKLLVSRLPLAPSMPHTLRGEKNFPG